MEQLVKIRKLGKSIGSVVTQMVAITADGKVTKLEGLRAASALGGLAFLVIGLQDDLKQSIKDGFSQEEESAVYEGFCEGFDIPNDEKELKVEEYFGKSLDLVRTMVSFLV